MRLYVNGITVINNWNSHGGETAVGTIDLTAGVRYPIQVKRKKKRTKGEIYASKSGG